MDIGAEIDVSWIPGHQDKKKPYSDLPEMGKLNCQADDLATCVYELPKPEPDDHHLFPAAAIQVLNEYGTPVMSKIPQAMHKRQCIFLHTKPNNSTKMDGYNSRYPFLRKPLNY